MSCANNENCVFRQMAANPGETPPSVARVFAAFGEEEPQTPGDAAEMLAAMEAPICTVDGCGLTAQGLMRYVTSAGNDAPRQELDESVAPGCAILDVPHTAEEELGPYLYPDDPRNDPGLQI